MAVQSANIPTVKVLNPTTIITATPAPQFSLTERQAYLIPLLSPLFVVTVILIVSRVLSKRTKVLKINNDILKILLLTAILTVLLIIAWQTRYEYFDGHDVLRLDKLTGTVELRLLLEEIEQSKGVR